MAQGANFDWSIFGKTNGYTYNYCWAYQTVFSVPSPVYVFDAYALNWHAGKHGLWVATGIQLLIDGVVQQEDQEWGYGDSVLVPTKHFSGMADEVRVCGRDPNGQSWGLWYVGADITHNSSGVWLNDQAKQLGVMKPLLQRNREAYWRIFNGTVTKTNTSSSTTSSSSKMKVGLGLGGTHYLSSLSLTATDGFYNNLGPTQALVTNNGQTVYDSGCDNTYPPLVNFDPPIAANQITFVECGAVYSGINKGTITATFWDIAGTKAQGSGKIISEGDKSVDLGSLTSLLPGLSGSPQLKVDNSYRNAATLLWFDAANTPTTTPQDGVQQTTNLNNHLYTCTDNTYDGKCDWESAYPVTIGDTASDVMTWLGGSTDYTEITAQSTDTANAYACIDADKEKTCDFIQAKPCLDQGGDWIAYGGPNGHGGTCCGAAATGMDTASCGTYLQDVGICGKTADGKWKWASNYLPGDIADLRPVDTGCPDITVVSNGSGFYECGGSTTDIATLDARPLAWINNISDLPHYYSCNRTKRNATECAGSHGGLSMLNSMPTGTTLLTPGGTYYCASDGIYTKDLDSKDEESCTKAGFAWLAKRCCSEADDAHETYEAPGDIGVCWDSTFVANGNTVEDGTILAFNGTLQGCNAAVSAAPAQSCTPDGLVSWWKAEGNVQDSVDGNDGKFNGVASYSAGHTGQAFSLSTSSSVNISDNPNLDFGSGDDFTISAWMKPVADSSYDGGYVIVYKISPSVYLVSQPSGYELYYMQGALSFYLISQGTTATITENDSTNYGPSFWQDQWHHVAAERQGKQLKLYIDGVLVKTQTTLASGSLQNSQPLYIGGYVIPSGNFRGALDEVQIYDHALSDADVQALSADDLCSLQSSGSSPSSAAPTSHEACDVIPGSSASGEYFCSSTGKWKVDSPPTNRTELKNIAWTAPAGTLLEECCNTTSCWTGDSNLQGSGVHQGCQNDQLGAAGGYQYPFGSTDSGYRCEGGNWILRTLRYSWDRGVKGYCPREDQCLITTAGTGINNDQPDKYFDTTPGVFYPQCIADGQYIKDHACENGIWSTRTKNIALQLFDYIDSTSPTAYRLFCDKSDKALNVPQSVANYVGDSSCSILGTGVPCVNNFCVLETPNGVAWGVSLNNPVDDAAKSFLTNPTGVNKAATACDNALSGTGYTECSGAPGLWYNPQTNSLISIPSGTLGGTSVSEWFDQFIADPLNALKQFVSAMLNNPGVGNDFSFFDNTHTFNKLYAARADDHMLFAFYETGIKFSTALPPKDYIGVRYANVDLGPNPCFNLIQKYDGKAACTNSTGEMRIVTDVYQTATPPIANAWRDLTAKLRPG
ncbi:MAG TPA: LamG domain-containing protein [Candidatus Binatia bacterium]|nr:LamG domain-containing protein [Candidatus Binatia bacterium]